MRFTTYAYEGVERAGVVRDGVIHPLPPGTTVLSLVEQEALHAAGSEALSVGSDLTVDQVRLLAPLKPPSIRDFVGFEAHIEGVAKSLDGLEQVPEEWYRAPNFYFTNPHAAYGAHDDVPVPAGCSVLDFELEVGAVVGRAGRTSRPSGPASTSSATSSSTTGRRAICRNRRRTSVSASPRARTSRTPSARTWSRPTRWRTGATRTASSTWR